MTFIILSLWLSLLHSIIGFFMFLHFQKFKKPELKYVNHIHQAQALLKLLKYNECYIITVSKVNHIKTIF